MVKPLIKAQNLTLQIPIIMPTDRKIMSDPRKLLRDFYFSRTSRGFSTILDDVSFTLEPGMRLGLIGANGAGKSTLLRVLAGIYAPTSGSLKVNGVAKGLFDISMGMQPEATGLENIYMRGLQMGLNLKQIKKLIPEIINFAELEEVIDSPFNTFSTGMRMRLAFSISTMVEPDILLLDEWIGTGDARFRDKVTMRMERLVENSRGLVLASHSLMLMKGICTHGLLLSKGKLKFFGDLDEALEVYEQEIKAKPK